VLCEASRELIWVLPPLLAVCKLPPRPRPRPRPHIVYPVFRSNVDGPRRVDVSTRLGVAEPAGWSVESHGIGKPIIRDADVNKSNARDILT
jgi:hypothetical protein